MIQEDEQIMFQFQKVADKLRTGSRVTFPTNLAHATKRPANTMKKNSCTALPWVNGTSSAHTVTRNITLCLFLLSLNLISHTLIKVVTIPFLKRPSRVAKVIMFGHGYDMEGKRRRTASFAGTGGPRAPLRSNFDDPEGWDTSFSEEECSQQDVVQHMVPVAGRPITMCGTSGCSGSCLLSAVENGYEAEKKPATCQTCGRIFPRPNNRNVSPVTSRRSRNTSPVVSRRSMVVSWSDSPRDQAVLGEQSRSHVGTAVPAAMGPCAPSEPVPHSSGFVVTSEHAVTSGVETRVDCAVSHGFCTSPAHLARSQPGVSTQCAHVSYPGVELVSRATYTSRKKRNLETVQRQSKALKKVQRDAKRKFVAQPEISHEAAELI